MCDKELLETCNTKKKEVLMGNSTFAPPAHGI